MVGNRFSPVIVLAALAIAACSPQSGGASKSKDGEPVIKVTPTPMVPGELTLPLDAYKPSIDKAVQYQQARNRLVRRCMSRFGVDWTLPARTVPRVNVSALRLGLLDEQEISRYGYRGDPALAKDRETARANGGGGYEVPGRAAKPYYGEGKTYNGVLLPEGGCEAEAYRALGGSLSGDDVTLWLQLRGAAEKRTREDGRMRVAIVRWRECMDGSGFKYSSPDAAEQDPRWANERDHSAEPADAQQLKTAMADFKCRSKTNLVGVRLSVQRAYEQRLVERNIVALREQAKAIDQRISKAARSLQ